MPPCYPPYVKPTTQQLTRLFVLLITSLVLLWLPTTSKAEDQQQTLASSVVVIDNFEQGLNNNWQRKEFDGQTRYRVIVKEGATVLHATSDDSASALLFAKEYSLRDYPLLSWRWKIDGIISNGDARDKQRDDYAARIYVVFPHWFFPMTRSINYIWANKLPKGTHIASSYTSRSMMIAVESGRDHVGQWRLERRNVLEDYRHVFGEEPPLVGAIAIMTDTDNTGERVQAWYDDIRIESHPAQISIKE